MRGSPLVIKKIPLEQLNEIAVKTAWGNIEVLGGEYQEIVVEVYVYRKGLQWLFGSSLVKKVEFDQLGFKIYKADNKLIIANDAADEHWIMAFFNGFEVSFRVFVPYGFSTYVQNRIGDVQLQNLKGKQLIRCTMGKISLLGLAGEVRTLVKNFGGGLYVDQCDGKVNLNTAGGNISVKNSKGDQEYTTDGGNIEIENFDGKINTKTKGGNVQANLVRGDFKTLSWGGNIKLYGLQGNVAATTKGGNIYAEIDELSSYVWLDSSGGNIRAYLPENAAFQLNAKGSKLQIADEFSLSGKIYGNRADGKVNGGGADVSLRTMGGKVKIMARPVFKAQSYESNEAKVQQHTKQPYKITDNSYASVVTTTHKKVAEKVYEEPKEKRKWSFKPNFGTSGQVLFALFFTVLMVYGLNSITYFTIQLVKPTSAESVQNQAVFVLNLITGLSAFMGVILYIKFLDNWVQKLGFKYLMVVVSTLLVYVLVQSLFMNTVQILRYNPPYIGFYERVIHIDKANTGNILFYIFMPSIVALVYFLYWRKSTDMTRKISEQEYQLLNLEKIKTQAQLNALEARINPHFLYNSLNSIAGLIHENADKAEDMTVQLSKLFRASTGRNNEPTHRIAEEIALVKSYLAIEQMRFGERLDFKIEVDEKLENRQIPRFLLQPLVENAIKHGIAKISEKGVIALTIKEVGEQIGIEIYDNGPAFGTELSGGYGLKSVKEKLDLFYKGHASLEIANEPKKVLKILMDKAYEIQNNTDR